MVNKFVCGEETKVITLTVKGPLLVLVGTRVL